MKPLKRSLPYMPYYLYGNSKAIISNFPEIDLNITLEALVMNTGAPTSGIVVPVFYAVTYSPAHAKRAAVNRLAQQVYYCHTYKDITEKRMKLCV